MMIALLPDVRARLDAIEADEGISAAEIANQAISVWSYLNGDERRRLGIAAIGMVVERHRGVPS
ncbi:hypothetical protein [Aureimonas glaciei]|uniref:Uncharacterized protein n=1 Tax=Aureimonas glaciei TaxID=1776957 RepID=A0A916Y481_9HYPH|nr:hypothetical protein [Aureimonas glaciei]GGD28919.1 hypothetical protein GCM10011335_35120 [Aureimonas glaciei]